MERERGFWQRFNDPNNELNRKDFIIAYFGWWAACILIVVLVDIFFSLGRSGGRGLAIGLSVGFFQIFTQRLRYFGMNKWIALLAFPLITNPILFIYLALKGDHK